METKVNDLEKFEKLLNEFKELEELSQKIDETELACRISLQKIKIAREFAKIDEIILNKSLEASANSGQFFSDILFLEAKRLRFKEEASKCIQTKTRSKIST